MNKLFSKIATLSVGLAMAVGVGVAVGHKGVKEVKADSVTANWNASSQGFTNEQQLAGTSYTFDDDSSVSISFAEAVSNGHKYFNSGSAIRSYGNNSFTISCSVGNITSITLSNNQSKEVTADVGTYSSNSWTGSAASVTFTVASGSGNFRTSTLVVVHEGGEAPTGPFTVTYNGNGATSGSMTDTHEYQSGDTVTIMACAFMKDDYEVTGWNTKANGSGTAYGLSAQFTIESNVTLYAQWKYVGKGSEDNPYTVAEAIAAIDSSSFPTPAYVEGIIAQVDSYNSTYHSITYWISDDGATTTMLEVYSGKGIGGADFEAKEDIEVGASVVVTGTLKKYKSTYEFDLNNELVSYTAPVHEDPTLSLSSVKAHLVSGGASVVVTASFESFSGTPTLSVVGEPECAYVTINGTEITIAPKYALGTEKITFRATYNTEVADKDFNLVVTTNSGAAENPFLVSEAKDVIDVMENVNGYVLGVVSQVDSYNETYHSITYWISDDGTTEGQLQCYSAKGYNGANFSSVDDMKVGTGVVVQGTLKKYNDTYEFDKNNRIVAFPNVENFGDEIINRTDLVCQDYDGHTDNGEAIAAIWTILAGEGYYADLSDTEKDFLKTVGSDESGSGLEQAMARYEYLTGKYNLVNFIEGRTPVAFANFQIDAVNNGGNSYIIIIVISAVSVLSFGLALALKKKRTK